MIKTIDIDYAGARINVCEFLKDLWPYQLPPDKWPTFCGAGDGIGDAFVKDVIKRIAIAFICFDHDVRFAISPNTREAFDAANDAFLRNLAAVILASPLKGDELAEALSRCLIYYAGVDSPIGWLNFEPCGEVPWTNPVVKARLKRLANAMLGIPEQIPAGLEAAIA